MVDLFGDFACCSWTFCSPAGYAAPRAQTGPGVYPVPQFYHVTRAASLHFLSSIPVREWVEASLCAPLSEVSWVIWRYDWSFAAGEHVFEVRCFDGNGEEQIAEDRPPPPSGSAGIRDVTTTL
jgi:hypothetical protein